MPITSFDEFQNALFALLETPQFNGQTFLDYLARDKSQRSGDEASIVDNAICGPLLDLLGFSPGEQVYNAAKSDQTRPDFAPRLPEIGNCFVIEDKATAIDLEDAQRAQLAGYVRANGVKLGLLCNGRAWELWEFGPKTKQRLLVLDLKTWLQLRRDKQSVPAPWERDLETIFDLLRRDAFTSIHTLAAQLAISAEAWRENAQKLDGNAQTEANLIEDLRELVGALQRAARRQLDVQLDEAAALKQQLLWADDTGAQSALQVLAERRQAIKPFLAFVIQDDKHGEELDEFLTLYALNPLDWPSQDFFLEQMRAIINARRDKAVKSLDELPSLKSALEHFAGTVLTIHARQTRLRQKARVALAVQDDFAQWIDLVSETMLGDLSKNKTAAEAEDAQRAEFALQAAYVVFIRLLLIRICEDKGLFPQRFLSNGGLLFWQESIRRYLQFVQGNRYEPLLKMAYDNAANIYAHFFTGRELFNWYQMDEGALLEALSRLAKYDFAQVDSDLLGTVYNAYVLRHEKKKQGQYYTPRPIVDFILDEVQWRDKNMVGDQKRLIDPACGSGTFLVRAAKRLMDAYRDENGEIVRPRVVLSKVRDKIYGFDLNPFACYLAEVNLLIQVLDAVRALPANERQTHLERFHIYNVDALAKAGRGILALGHDSLLAEELDVVERIKARKDAYASGFSHVVANPPYGAKVSDDYKRALRRDYPAVFRGQPDTYVFFYALALDLLGEGGRLGFITPNTFLMGTNTDVLRGELLRAGRIERIVDLPQGIWDDATVDCVLLFLQRERESEKRDAQQVEVNLTELDDGLQVLAARNWAETLHQAQSAWREDTTHAMDIRRDAIQIAIENACVYQKKISEMEYAPEVLRLGDVTDSSQGIIPYTTAADGHANLYIRAQRDVPHDDDSWKPLLDGSGHVGRYELRWGREKPYLKYSSRLGRGREERYFNRPKLLVQAMRNRSLERRLLGNYDESNFYNRHNFNNIIAEDPNYDLKYLLALFNSRLLNYWYRRKFDNVNINPLYFRQIPIFPADAATQTAIVQLVDELLAVQRDLNAQRAAGATIKQRGGAWQIRCPVETIVSELQSATPPLETLDLADARAVGWFSLPSECDGASRLSANIAHSPAFPTRLTLKFRRLWLEVPQENARRFLRSLLARPQFTGKSWNELEADDTIRLPAADDAFARVFARLDEREAEIRALLARTEALDRRIDERVLDLYGIADAQWRAKILDAAPDDEEDEGEA